MKNIAKSLVVASAFAVVGTVSADIIADLNPYVGAEYQQTWMHGSKNTSINNVSFKTKLPSSYGGASVFLGTKFNENVGLELGGDFSRKKKTFSNPVASDQYKVRVKGFHADLVGFMPVADCTELFASLGVGFVRPKTEHTLNVANAGAVQDQYTFKRKTIARVGLGANYMVTDMFGLRAKLGWENTSRVRAKDAQGAVAKMFKDATTASVGAFVRF